MSFLHLLIVHASGWICILMVGHVNRTGLPQDFYDILKDMERAVVLGLMLGVCSAHAHSHYLSYVKELL